MFVERAGGLGGALARAKARAFTSKLVMSAVLIGVWSLLLGGGQEPGGATGGGSSEANGLELSGICGPSDQFSSTATMRVRSANAA